MAAKRARSVKAGKAAKGRPGAKRVRVDAASAAPRDQVSEMQRARMLSAMVEVVADVGYAKLSVAQVLERAGVSRRTFYELFESREDCFLAAFDEAVRDFGQAVGSAYESQSTWLDGIRAGLATLLTVLEREPAIAWLVLVESWGAGERTLGRCAEVSSALAAVVDLGRTGRGGKDLSPITSEGIVGGVLSVIRSNLKHHGSSSLIELFGPLMSMIVLPYMGPAKARRELQRPAPKIELARAHPGRRPERLLEGVGMRLTYRTLLVLSAIESNPKTSNSGVAAEAGISDQGQISKLLSRLEALGLVENSSSGFERGSPNAWSLTAAGKRIVQSIEAWREGGVS